MSSTSSSSSSSPSRKGKDETPKDPLMKAALNGEIEFLRECKTSNKPDEYYLTNFEKNKHDRRNYGNIFHLAVLRNKKEFIKEAIELLPLQIVQQLLLQPQDEDEKENPLHISARRGRLEIVELFLGVYKSSPLPADLSKRPWLQKASDGLNPCHTAISNYEGKCGLEIWKMDPELLSNEVCNDCGVLYEAIYRELTDFALEILRSSYTINCKGRSDNTPMHCVADLHQGEGTEILKLLLKRQPEQIKHRNEDGESVFHEWADEGQIWPFECLLQSSSIIRNVREIFVELVASTTHDEGNNPLHVLAESSDKDEYINIAKLLIDTYKKEVAKNGLEISEEQLPWVVSNKNGDTPLSLAIENKDDKFPLYILSVDNNALKHSKDALFSALENGCNETAVKIMEIVKKEKWTELLTNAEGSTALHLAPKCENDTFFKQILEANPELLEEYDEDGNSVLMSWVKANDIRPVQYILESGERRYLSRLAELIDDTDYENNGNNPLHVVIDSPHEGVDQMVKSLVEVYKKVNDGWKEESPDSFPWYETNNDDDSPLHLAIRNKREALALYLLSLSRYTKDGGQVIDTIQELLDLYEPEHQILFLAIENHCYEVAKEILERLEGAKISENLDANWWDKYLMDSSTKRNILHLAPSVTDQEFGTRIVNKASKFICEKRDNGKTPLEEACNVGAAWFITASLKAEPSAIHKAPLAWVEACKKGHVSPIRAFIEYDVGAFQDNCTKYNVTPLHHLQKQNLTRYEEILNLPLMKDLINLQDIKGETALHIAIRRKDKFLTEALLKTEKIQHNIKDHDDKTAIDLLVEECKNPEWDLMCQRIGFDPELKTSYFERHTNLSDVRNSLFVVAALLATITFTAGFTLPGGLDQNNGEAMMARRLSFHVFLISNTLGMCSSMLVLICLVWSMVSKSKNTSLLLMDRSMYLLLIALYTTILAFMTGVYLAVSRRTFWLSITVIVLCSLMWISANRKIFYKFLLIPSRKKRRDHKHIMHRMEQGGITREEQDPLLHEQNMNQGRQAVNQSNENMDEEEQIPHEQHPNPSRTASEASDDSEGEEQSHHEKRSNQGRQSTSESSESSDDESEKVVRSPTKSS